jgi:hypothetical protein
VVSYRSVVCMGAAVVLASVAATSAAATLIPSQGIDGIKLQMTEAQVRAQLGAPATITQSRGALGNPVTRLHYPRLDVDLQRLSGSRVVTRVLTTHPGEETASGIGVGSSLAAVKRLSGSHCWWEAAAHYCRIGSRAKPASRLTMFWIDAKQRVTLVSVSLVVNS